MAGSTGAPTSLEASWHTAITDSSRHTKNGGHGALTRGHGLLHQLPAAAHGTGGGGELDRPGGDVSRVFSQRMSGKIISGGSSRGQNSQGRHGYGEDRGLGELRQAELLFGSVKAELRQVEAKRIIRFLKSLARNGKSVGKGAAHADAL